MTHKAGWQDSLVMLWPVLQRHRLRGSGCDWFVVLALSPVFHFYIVLMQTVDSWRRAERQLLLCRGLFSSPRYFCIYCDLFRMVARRMVGPCRATVPVAAC